MPETTDNKRRGKSIPWAEMARVATGSQLPWVRSVFEAVAVQEVPKLKMSATVVKLLTKGPSSSLNFPLTPRAGELVLHNQRILLPDFQLPPGVMSVRVPVEDDEHYLVTSLLE